MPGFPRIALFALAGLVLGIRAEQRPSSHPADPGPEGLFRSVEERYLKEESLQWRALVNADMMTLTVKFETGNRFSILEEGGEHERDLWHLRCDGSKLRLAGGWEGVAPEGLSSHVRRMLVRWGSFAATEAPFKAEAEHVCSADTSRDESLGEPADFKWGKEERGVDGQLVRVVEYTTRQKSPNAPAGGEPWGHQVWIETQTLTILKRVIILRGGSLTEAYDYAPAAGDTRPAHTAEVAANEAIAERDLEGLIDAEIYFWKDLGHKTFAYDLARLRTEPAFKASKIALILELGRKDGYLYGTLATCDGTGSSNRRFGYAYYAVPEKYGKTGQWTYIVNQEQCIYFKDTGSNLPPSEWPRNLAKQGWVKLAQ